MDLVSKRVGKLLINGITIVKDLCKNETSYKTRPMTKYVIFAVYKSFLWLTSVKVEKDKKFCPISEAGQMICCSSKKVDCTLSLSHFLANKIAGKPVRISYYVLMCWYELTV